MNQESVRFINDFRKLRVIVLGEAMLDSYWRGTSNRLCREAPVPVVDVRARVNAPGGAANTAANVSALGAHVTYLSVIGDDMEGALLQTELRVRGVETDALVIDPSRTTISKNRVISGPQVVVRFDQGSTEDISGTAEELMLQRLEAALNDADAIIISDYGYGIATRRVVQTIAGWQAANPQLLAVDSKDLCAYRHVTPAVVKPNYQEVTKLLGIPTLDEGDRAAQILEYEQEVLSLTGAQVAAVTLDQDGALFFERGNPPYRTYAEPQPHSQAAGAGDTFMSALMLALAAGAPTYTAAEIASAAAALVASRDGTTACTATELRGYGVFKDKTVADVDKLADRIAYYRAQGQQVVFTNGCFDILHRGHVTYLNRAKALGDVLVIGLNSDDSVRRLKGETRPINRVEDRAEVLGALSCVDHVISFEEDTPERLIRAIRPDVYVKGGDYARETLPETPVVEELGGEVRILPYLEDFSTTNIIGRISQTHSTDERPWPVAVQKAPNGVGRAG